MSKPKKSRFTGRGVAQAKQKMNTNNNHQPEQTLETYQAISDYFNKLAQDKPNGVDAFPLRKETFLRIEQLTERPLICYVTRTSSVPQGAPAFIEDSDLTGFSDLILTTPGNAVDVFLVSNGGAPEATERIVQLIRDRFESVRFIVPANAFSAATLMCFSGDEVLMDFQASLGPIDPQINGIPARAILRAFETLEERLKVEGPNALTAYMPMLSKYDLHLLEICKSTEELSKELARNWLSTYMLKCSDDDERVNTIVQFFSDYDTHKSHGRSINRGKALELGLKVSKVEDVNGLASLVRGLYNQYVLFFEKTGFYKLFESARGINWGRAMQNITVQLPVVGPQGVPQVVPPGPPERSN